MNYNYTSKVWDFSPCRLRNIFQVLHWILICVSLAAFNWIILTYFIWNNWKGTHHSKIQIILPCTFYESWMVFFRCTVYKTQTFNSKLLYDFRRLGIWCMSQNIFIRLSRYLCALLAVWQPLVPITFHYIEITAWEILWVNFYLQTSNEFWLHRLLHWLRT